MGGHGADDTGAVVNGRHSRVGVGWPAVRLGGGGVDADEAVQAGGGEVVDGGEADAARFKAFDPDGISSNSTSPDHGLRSGSAMAHSSQAVL